MILSTSLFSHEEIKLLQSLSMDIDELWKDQATLRSDLESLTRDVLSIFGHTETSTIEPSDIRKKDQIYSKFYKTEKAINAGSYARLKFAMDYWSSLWFWPIEKASLLPKRKEFLLEMSQILVGKIDKPEDLGVTIHPDGGKSRGLFPTGLEELADDLTEHYKNYGKVDIKALCDNSPRLALVKEITEKHKFMHWELEFADIFKKNGGFDLVIGNPPWIKLKFEQADVLSDSDPIYAVKHYSSSQINKIIEELLNEYETKKVYFSEFESITGIKSFFNAPQNYNLLKGQQSDLYKCFLPQSFYISNSDAVIAFIHPESVYTDPKGGLLRKELYRRLKFRLGFKNVLSLFPEVGSDKFFYLNIYINFSSETPCFNNIDNLYSVDTIDECFVTDITTPIPFIKDNHDKWNLKGHPERIIKISKTELETFAKLFYSNNNWLETPLPLIYSTPFLSILEILSNYPKTLESIGDNIFHTEMWHETNSQKDGIIKKNIHIPESSIDMIFSGPHINVANPFFQCARPKCKSKGDYDVIDLLSIPENYRQRVIFSPACDNNSYLEKVPKTKSGKRYNSDYYLIVRKMINLNSERTFTPVIMPKNSGHINSLIGLLFQNNLSTVSASMSSIIFDFLIKSFGKPNAHWDIIKQLPLITDKKYFDTLSLRSLLLNCLTNDYSELWTREFKNNYTLDRWAKKDPRLLNEHFSSLTPEWSWNTPLRSDYERRQALIEIDVLTALSLGLNLEHLKTIYLYQFPLLQKNENSTLYDKNGRIVFTNSTSLTGVGFTKNEWEPIKEAKSGTFKRTIIDNTLGDKPVERIIEYVAPFDRCNRVDDYDTTWEYFSCIFD